MPCRNLRVIASLTSVLLVGCSVPANTPTPTHTQEATTTQPGSRAMDPAHAPVVLGVSNQSHDDPDVALTVTVDGLALIEDGSYAVENQHNLDLYGIDLQPGQHTVTVTADSAVRATRTFTLAAGKRRWVSIFYWNFDPSRKGVTWGGNEQPGPAIKIDVHDEPIVLA